MKLASTKKIGARLKAARKRGGMGLDAVATHIRVHPTTVQKWEAGQVMGAGRLMVKAALLVGISPNDLFLDNI